MTRLLDVPAAAIDAAHTVLAEHIHINPQDPADRQTVIDDVLCAVLPAVLAADRSRLADELTEMANDMRSEDELGRVWAKGLVEGITQIREHAAAIQQEYTPS